MERLGDLEAEVMDQVWAARGPVAVRGVRDALHRTRPLAYTTVMTVMDRLFHKGWLVREHVGRSYQYRPALSRGEYTARMMRDVLSTTDDRGLALLHFVDTMDPAEYEALQEALRWHQSRTPRAARSPRVEDETL
ncbi:BlaI/MecI/CopY family transcriptional regulator [Candidatus Protofrankia californiensis]|uniref:BlaI/MecI/CopY family transcriptional regulator n=1 Tax=Candidatus Protofrankia californiensis TaxID=1839754 RepID=UPI0010410390|nr:BlaI/MecI/CopY family transcriptional regulator [Candidatus Protofrankia californiensis]